MNKQVTILYYVCVCVCVCVCVFLLQAGCRVANGVGYSIRIQTLPFFF